MACCAKLNFAPVSEQALVYNLLRFISCLSYLGAKNRLFVFCQEVYTQLELPLLLEGGNPGH